MKRVYLIVTAVALVIACNSENQKKETKASVDSTTTELASAPPKVGSGRDEHGCIGSAGYQWSVLKNRCIRTFDSEEADAELVPTEDTSTYTSSAILVFNNDLSKAELFMPNQNGSLILNRTGKEGNFIWKNDSLELFSWKGYMLRKNGKVIFHGE